MLLKLFLLFTIIPIAEIFLLGILSEKIGLLNTIIIVVLTGIIGAGFARTQGSMVIGKIKSELNSGIMPGKEILEGVLILAGGILLITPGIITDLLGFSLIFPLSRKYYGKLLFSYFKKKFTIEDNPYNDFNNDNSDDDNIIDI